MTVTNAESEWLVRVMRTISTVTIEEPCPAFDRLAQDCAAEDVLRAAQSFIRVLQEPGE
jgi:hypothetical protein